MLTRVNEFCRKHPTEFGTPQRVYTAVREGVLPIGVAVRLGRKILINEEKYQAWINAGGSALPGGWRREVA